MNNKIYQSVPSGLSASLLPIPIVMQVDKVLSGSGWCLSFPGSESIGDLSDPFKSNFIEFYTAMAIAGASLNISSTYRPKERAYLMRYSYEIKHGLCLPKKVPEMSGVAIEWDHGNDIKSIAAAADMTKGFNIDGLATTPSDKSLHISGLAVDLQITWKGDLSIMKKDGSIEKITSLPRDRMNKDLHKVGAGYGVLKFHDGYKDKPHWSSTSF